MNIDRVIGIYERVNYTKLLLSLIVVRCVSDSLGFSMFSEVSLLLATFNIIFIVVLISLYPYMLSDGLKGGDQKWKHIKQFFDIVTTILILISVFTGLIGWIEYAN